MAILLNMANSKYTTIKASLETKKDLDDLKLGNESYNDVILRLIQENKQYKEILLNIEKLKEHIN